MCVCCTCMFPAISYVSNDLHHKPVLIVVVVVVVVVVALFSHIESRYSL